MSMMLMSASLSLAYMEEPVSTSSTTSSAPAHLEHMDLSVRSTWTTVPLSPAPQSLAVEMVDSVWTVWVAIHAPVLQDLLENTVKAISMSAGRGPAMPLAALTVCSWSMTTSVAVALDILVVIVSPWWICVCPNHVTIVESAQ